MEGGHLKPLTPSHSGVRELILTNIPSSFAVCEEGHPRLWRRKPCLQTLGIASLAGKDGAGGVHEKLANGRGFSGEVGGTFGLVPSQRGLCRKKRREEALLIFFCFGNTIFLVFFYTFRFPRTLPRGGCRPSQRTAPLAGPQAGPQAPARLDSEEV